MLSWDTTYRLVRSQRPNPLLLGLVLEELENAIEELKDKREDGEQLSETEEELLRGFMLKRYLIVKKMRDRFRIQDYDEYHGQERVAREYSNGSRLTRRRDSDPERDS